MSARTVVLLLLTALTLTALPATAAGLGKMTIHSALGQPLNAEIEITALQPKEFESLTMRVASAELYQERGATHHSLVRQIRLTPVKRDDGTAFMRVTSHSPVNEPSVDILIEFTWPNGRLVQKFPVLLDPAR